MAAFPDQQEGLIYLTEGGQETEVMYKQQAVGTDENPSTRYCLSQDEVRKYNVHLDERPG